MYKLTANDGFTASYAEKPISRDIVEIKLEAHAAKKSKLELKLSWEIDDLGVHLQWSPLRYDDKAVRPNWSDLAWSESSAMFSAPLRCGVAYDDSNRITVACSDAKNNVKICLGVLEATAKIENTVAIRVDCEIDTYESVVRIDTRHIPFYKCVEDASKWWEGFEGYTAAEAPSIAKEPMYSTWYSFHRSVDTEHIIDQCRYFAKLGCKAVIVDDGWQTVSTANGYSYCGDWQPSATKVADMKQFVDAVHEAGMKFLLWFSVPFVGKNSCAYERFKDKMLCKSAMADTWILDPRYPEVRDYLINIYKNALLSWGLDGFKLDFIDSFRQSDTVLEGMDFVSVYDAVDKLMKDVLSELRRIKPDIMVEFRQGYMGPLMRTFGNIFRVADCPGDSMSNRIGTLNLRMTGGRSAVHSDMVMWNAAETAEMAAFQLTNVLFAVPQISVLHEKLPAEHVQMLKSYLEFWKAHSDVLLDGEMTFKGYAENYSYASSLLGDRQVCAVYSGRTAYIEPEASYIAVVNASMDREVFLEARKTEKYSYAVTDCMGREREKGELALSDLPLKLSVPVNGRIVLKAAKK